ncbi:MAG TPA: PD-(D/E)XK nuclease family protein, partial [Thermoanaerobaculia bacterium]|nr:PD-(D/E)XK nuclease family protein [Thermoanaerobaculia bacterium]
MTVSRRGSGRHRIFCGPFSALEPKLFAEIADLQREDPLRAVTIIVASNLLGVHLRRRYVEWREDRRLFPAHGGLSFSTLEAFATQVAGPGAPPLPPFGEFALLSSALARLPEARVFGDLAGRPELVPSIEATLRDLADAGVAPKAFRAFVEGGTLPAERRLLLGALARLYEELDRGAAGRETRAKTFRRAAASRDAGAEPLLLYGFYDATGLQKEFLAAAARRRPVAAFVPRPPGRYGEFADPFLRWAEESLPASLDPVAAPAGPLDDFNRRLGGDHAAPAPSRDAVRLVSAAGAAGERTEIAREILMVAETGLPLHGIGVVVRESSAWSGALSRELARLGIPNFELSSESVVSSPLGRAVRIWWDLEEREFPREDVLDLFDLLRSAGAADSPESARDLARRAGIVRGAADWTERLRRLADSPRSETEGRAARSFAAECDRLVASARDWPRAPLEWTAWSAEIARRLEALFAPEAVPAPLVSAAEAVGALGPLGGAVERGSAAHVFFGALEELRPEPGRLGVDGVFVGSAMAARGLTFAMTIVAHLVEREFPAPGRPDPLFFDAERRALAAETGRAVPLKVEARSAEERELFGIAAGSARELLVLSASRRDEALTRDCLPSPFFADAERAASPGGEKPTRVVEMGVPVAFGPSVSESEACDRALARSGAATVASVFAPVARALARQDLAHAPVWTAFEGRLGPASREALARHRPSALDSLSASRVAWFATCPYRYFLRSVQGMREWDEADRVGELDPLSLGNTFHDAARRLVTASRDWPPPPAGLVALVARVSEEALARHEEKNAPLVPALVRELARDRLEALLRVWLAFEAERGDSLRPAAAERPLGAGSEPFVLDAGAFPIRFRGSIDRVDEDRDGRPARVVDYKVKMAPGFAKEFRAGGRIVGGEAVQLPVYALAAGGEVASEYLVLLGGSAGPAAESVPFSPEETKEAIAALRSFLAGMEAAIAS